MSVRTETLSWGRTLSTSRVHSAESVTDSRIISGLSPLTSFTHKHSKIQKDKHLYIIFNKKFFYNTMTLGHPSKQGTKTKLKFDLVPTVQETRHHLTPAQFHPYNDTVVASSCYGDALLQQGLGGGIQTEPQANPIALLIHYSDLKNHSQVSAEVL